MGDVCVYTSTCTCGDAGVSRVYVEVRGHFAKAHFLLLPLGPRTELRRSDLAIGTFITQSHFADPLIFNDEMGQKFISKKQGV